MSKAKKPKSAPVNYREYIDSEAWAEKRRQYYASGRPKTCRAMKAGVRCEATHVDLHHWTYRRLGHEKLKDLVPVCRECHKRIHELAKEGGPKALRAATATVCGPGPWDGREHKQRKPRKVRERNVSLYAIAKRRRPRKTRKPRVKNTAAERRKRAVASLRRAA